jgi:hypothetical protein
MGRSFSKPRCFSATRPASYTLVLLNAKVGARLGGQEHTETWSQRNCDSEAKTAAVDGEVIVLLQLVDQHGIGRRLKIVGGIALEVFQPRLARHRNA